MDNTQLLQRIDKLEKEMQNLKNSSTINSEIDKALQGRGFLKSNSLIYTGRVTIGMSGVSRIPIPGATAESVSYVTYTTFPAPGVPVSYIEYSTDHYELHIDADASYDVNFVVFLNNKGDFNNLA